MHRLYQFEQSMYEESFPLPMIDRLVNATPRHEMMSFLDDFSRYNQIFFHLDDLE